MGWWPWHHQNIFTFHGLQNRFSRCMYLNIAIHKIILQELLTLSHIQHIWTRRPWKHLGKEIENLYKWKYYLLWLELFSNVFPCTCICMWESVMNNSDSYYMYLENILEWLIRNQSSFPYTIIHWFLSMISANLNISLNIWSWLGFQTCMPTINRSKSSDIIIGKSNCQSELLVMF